MEPSEEIRRIVQRWNAAIAEGDADSALERLSEHSGTLVIGTDAAEWWRGQEAHAIWRRQIEEVGTHVTRLFGQQHAAWVLDWRTLGGGSAWLA